MRLRGQEAGKPGSLISRYLEMDSKVMHVMEGFVVIVVVPFDYCTNHIPQSSPTRGAIQWFLIYSQCLSAITPI